MSDTPRTDENAKDSGFTATLFSRQLERELNEAKEIADKTTALNSVLFKRNREIPKMIKNIQQLEHQRDQWREVARQLYHSHHDPTEYLRARAAFAALEKETK